MIRYATVLICILLYSSNIFTQEFNIFSLYNGDKRIAFNDSTILIVGGDYDGKTIFPCYWENNKKIMLGNEPGYVSGIFVEGDNVYMSGFILQEDNSTKPCYWKNDSLILLPGVSGWAYSFIVVNLDTYISGVVQKGYESYPCYWKNGKLSEKYGEATSVFTSNSGDLYFTGTVGSLAVGKAVCWKNGEMIWLSKIGSEGRTILVSDTDVYVAASVLSGWYSHRMLNPAPIPMPQSTPNFPTTWPPNPDYNEGYNPELGNGSNGTNKNGNISNQYSLDGLRKSLSILKR